MASSDPGNAAWAGGISARTAFAMAALLLALVLPSTLGGERIPWNGGLGFEAHDVYLPVAQDPMRLLAERKIDAYSVQRILPFVVAHVGLRLLGLPIDEPNVLRFFLAYNMAVLLGTLAAWVGLCRAIRLSSTGGWVGFIGLFLNFALLKLNTYYPVNYDPTAVLIGAWALLSYCRGSLGGLFLTSLAGMLVWPTILYYHALLLLLPRGVTLPAGGPPAAARNRAVVASVAVTAMAACLWVYFGLGERPRASLGQLVLPALPVSLACVGAWLYLGLSPLVSDSDLFSRAGVRALWERIDRRGAGLVLVLGASHVVLTRALAASGPTRYDLDRYSIQFVFGATTRPAQFLIAHAVYFGPVVLVLTSLWSRAAGAARKLGAGLVLASAAGVVQTLNCESRQLMNVLPLLALLAALAVDRLPLPGSFLPSLGVASWLGSKAWIPLNAWADRLGADMARFPIIQPIQEFPAQVYFMSFGPWMSHTTLCIQGLVALALGLGLCLGPLRAARVGARSVGEEASRHG